tara:strand:+ start:1681 stop:2511 length:831 start_codon:yes stop_codon:yes gene_type:complete
MKFYLCGSAKHLGIKSCKYASKKFPDGEIYVKLLENVKDKNVCVISSLKSSDDILETIFLVDALRRGMAKIKLLFTYLGYARQDKIFENGECLSFRAISKILKFPGVVVSVIDSHNFSNNKKYLNFEDYCCLKILKDKFSKMKNPVVVAPDKGSVESAKNFAKSLKCKYVELDKRRLGSEVYLIIRDVKEINGKNAIIVDDIIDTGKTVVKTVDVLKNSGAKNVYGVITHGIFSEGCKRNVEESCINKIYVTNTLPVKKSKKIEVVGVENFIRNNF